MRLTARHVIAFVQSAYRAFWHRVHFRAAAGASRNAGAVYRRIARHRPKTAADFLYAARAYRRRGDIDSALSTLEAGLTEYPDSERLLATYLRICCAHALLARVTAFINAKNRQHCATLARLDLASIGPAHQPIDDGQSDGVVCLTEAIIDKGCHHDVLLLWHFAELFEHAGRHDIANNVHRLLSQRAPGTPDEFVYGGASDMRLGNVAAGFTTLEQGLAVHPGAELLRSVYRDCCYAFVAFDRYLRLHSVPGTDGVEKPASAFEFYRKAFKVNPPTTVLLNLNEASRHVADDDVVVLKQEFLARLHDHRVPFAQAMLSLFFSKYLDLDAAFAEQIFRVLYSQDWDNHDKARYLLAFIYKLTLPPMPGHALDPEETARQFVADARALAQDAMELDEPLSDVGKRWAMWHSLFFDVQPRRYADALAALETLAFKLWPKLDHTAAHIHHARRSRDTPRRRIRVGFVVLDAMPMMSGLMERLDTDVFETVYLRPGRRTAARTADDWVARARTTVEYSDTNAYAAIDVIASQELDILISGPSVPQIFFPLMARLAHLQVVLLEPNWPDGIRNSDYYVSWQMAEPETYRDCYRTPVALLRNPPYWIERSSLGEVPAMSEEARTGIRQRLLGLGPKDRFYLCASMHTKVHPVMDAMLLNLLEMDPAGSLVFVRGEHFVAGILKARLEKSLGRHYARVTFTNTLNRNDAHSLLLAADCCLDSHPIGGMSSSFDGLMLGVPIVTLPADVPFGRWTAAIYEYIGVSGLTAKDSEEYLAIALRLAHDTESRREKSAEIREKSARYVENQASADEFQHFLVDAWHRKQAGSPPGNWVAGEWQ